MTLLIISIIIFLIIMTLGLIGQVLEEFFEEKDYGLGILKTSLVFVLISFIIFLIELI